MKSIFEFSEYKPYLLALWGGAGTRTGYRAKAAEHLGIQTAYVSQILTGHAHLSLEQAHKLNEFLGHDKEAAHFFLLLVQKDRAGTTDLKGYFQDQIAEVLNRRLALKNIVKRTKDIPATALSRYYGSWHYIAIHMAISIPELQTKQALAEHFGLPLKTVTEVIEFLLEHGLADEAGGRYRIGAIHIHLGNDSENIIRHHTNWRLQGLRVLDRGSKDELHYSVAYTLSREDAHKIRKKLTEMIEANLKLVGPSKEEVLFCNTIDFFEVKS